MLAGEEMNAMTFTEGNIYKEMEPKDPKQAAEYIISSVSMLKLG